MRFLKRKRNHPQIVPSLEYSHAMDFARQVIERENSVQDKVAILEFMLKVIKEDLKTDLLSHILYSQEYFTRHFNYPFPFFYSDENGNQRKIKELGTTDIELAVNCVLVLPWHRERLRNQVKNLFRNDFEYDRWNHKAYYFPYIDLCWAYNGTHSISSGVVYKKGTIEADQYELTELFAHLDTDGKSWYNIHNHEELYDLVDFRIGIIYSLAKLKYQLES